MEPDYDFVFFLMNYIPSCAADHPSPSFPSSGGHSGHDAVEPFPVPPGEDLGVVFRSDGSVGHRGFNISFRLVDGPEQETGTRKRLKMSLIYIYVG